MPRPIVDSEWNAAVRNVQEKRERFDRERSEGDQGWIIELASLLINQAMLLEAEMVSTPDKLSPSTLYYLQLVSEKLPYLTKEAEDARLFLSTVLKMLLGELTSETRKTYPVIKNIRDALPSLETIDEGNVKDLTQAIEQIGVIIHNLLQANMIKARGLPEFDWVY